MISLPLSPDVEERVAHLPENEKVSLSLLINAFVTKPDRSLAQVMDDMALYAKQQGLNVEDLPTLLSDK